MRLRRRSLHKKIKQARPIQLHGYGQGAQDFCPHFERELE